MTWRCFHCDEVFDEFEAARIHFGPTLFSEAACQIDAAALRELQAELTRYREEDTDLHRSIHAIQGEHATALRREEELGYARGLADAREAVAERERLQRLLNTPETLRFLEGTRIEVAHQIERWGTVHDRAKEPQDWFWLLGYLSGKALKAHVDGDADKAMHHCISSAAVLANWHTHIAIGYGLMTPGSSDLQAFLAATFGANFAEAQAVRATPLSPDAGFPFPVGPQA
jgi:hypothetical protein